MEGGTKVADKSLPADDLLPEKRYALITSRSSRT